jgi:hypothetical protein
MPYDLVRKIQRRGWSPNYRRSEEGLRGGGGVKAEENRAVRQGSEEGEDGSGERRRLKRSRQSRHKTRINSNDGGEREDERFLRRTTPANCPAPSSGVQR